jgi:hypothetical protein
LTIDWDGNGQAFLTGTATEVFRGEWISQEGGAALKTVTEAA